MPLSPAVAQWLIDEGHNAVHASDIGMAKATDAEILGRAKEEARTGGNWSETDVIVRMHELLQGLSETDIEQSMLIVDRQRVRRRRVAIAGLTAGTRQV